MKCHHHRLLMHRTRAGHRLPPSPLKKATVPTLRAGEDVILPVTTGLLGAASGP